MSNFIPGKLKFKNHKSNSTTVQIKETMRRSNLLIAEKISKTSQRKETKEQEENESISNKNVYTLYDLELREDKKTDITEENKKVKVYSTYTKIDKPEKNNSIIDNRTEAEKKFDSLRLKRLSDKIEKEVKTNKKENMEKFKELLDKQPNHYDIPKVGSGN